MSPALPGLSSGPRVAIASPGIGLVQRGFERMFTDLFAVVREDLDVTMIKGGGPLGERELVPAFLPRNGRFLQTIPLHWLIGRTRFHFECLTFALGMLPWLRAGRFDLVHVIDPPLARTLFHLRRSLRFRTRLLFTEGTAMPPQGYPPADHIHHISSVMFDESVRLGYPPGEMTLIPAGIRPEQFAVRGSRLDLRAKHGVSPQTFVVLCVAALSRAHKRIDHLVEEFSRLDGDCLLWIDGSMDHGDPDLPGWIRSRLGARCRISRVPSAEVGELYHLADVKVLASVRESFGLVVPEALSCGLPVLAHDNPHFRWLIGSEANLVDMRQPGALAARLRSLRDDPGERTRLRRRDEIVRWLDWRNLKREYLALYSRVLAAPPSRNGVRPHPARLPTSPRI